MEALGDPSVPVVGIGYSRGGRLNDTRFGKRMAGEGPMARQIRQLFKLFVRRFGLDGDLPAYDVSKFRPPRPRSGQGWLF